MKFRHVPARRGALWVRQGFGAFAVRPLAFTGLLACFLFFSFVLALVPWLGGLVSLGLFPLVSLGFMLATQLTMQGRFPLPTVFLLPLRTETPRRRAVLWLCASYGVVALLILLLAYSIGGTRMLALQQLLYSGNATPDAVNAQLADPALQFGLLTPMLLFSVLSLVFWHAPALVYWGGMKASKALFFSVVACWQNRGAFAVYTLTWFGAVFVVWTVIGLLLALLGQAALANLVVLPVWLMFASAFYGSLYFTFTDSFELPSDEPGSTP